MSTKKIIIIKRINVSQTDPIIEKIEHIEKLTLTKPKPNPAVYIDSSYFAFYRAHATRSWYVRAHPDDTNHDWINNPEFMRMYEAKFREHVGKIAKSLGVPMQSLVFARDCHREDIWRSAIFPQYKAHRTECEPLNKTGKPNNNMGPIIKYSNDNILSPNSPNRLPVKMIRVPGAEADDIIAVLTAYHNRVEPDREVWIVANDTDFYQLLTNSNNKIFKIGAKYTLTAALPTTDASTYLETKVLCGDKTDGIPPIFTGCGPVTATDFVNNPDTLSMALAKHPGAAARYALNRQLIDFREIPERVSNDIIASYVAI